MGTTDAELEAEQHQIRARIEELQSELSRLQARLQELAGAVEQRPRLRAMRSEIQLVAATKPERHEPIPVKVIPGAETKWPMDPVDLLRQSARGTALFAPGHVEGGGGEVVLLIRGESRDLAALGESPEVQFRAGVFTQPEAAVALVPVLVRLGVEEEPENLYETWVNNSLMGLEGTLRALAAQARIIVYLHGDDCRLERVLPVANPLQAFARAALDMLGAARPISADEFHQARAAVYKQQPTVRALWRALKA